jgi:ribonuclease HI
MTGFIKLNFDGASKGNPGLYSFGVVFRDDQGNILLILAGSLGHDTNNVAELWALIQGLITANRMGFTKLIVEGDSQIILDLFSKLLTGSEPSKISPSWRLLR